MPENSSPRAISPAERAAVEAAADFLHRGPAALRDRLATGSPLRQLGQAEGLKEIEVRTGPHAGAIWELQTVVPSLADRTAAFSIAFPSGLDETLILDFVDEQGSPRIQNLRILAEPVPSVAGSKKQSAVSSQPSVAQPSRLILMIGILGGMLAIAAALFQPRRAPTRMSTRGKPLHPPPPGPSRFVRPALSVAAIMLVSAGAGIAVVRDPRFHIAKTKSVESKDDAATGNRLAELLPLRRTVASGDQDSAPYFQKLPPAGLARDAAVLWKAQIDLQHMKTDQVQKALAAFPSPSNIPLAEMLRGRLGFFQAREVDAVLGYERAINLGPGRDALWYEAASMLSILGFDDLAEKYLDRLVKMASREPNVYYTGAMLAAADNDLKSAEEYLKKGWQLRPVERAELIEAAALWEVLRKDEVGKLIKLSSAEEASFASAEVSKRPVTLPPGAVTRVSGDFLHVQLGEQELLVPGGASLAPIGTPTVDAAEWNRTEERKALQQFPHLVRAAQSAGVFTQPVMRRKIEQTATALANHNRWGELVQLTDALSPQAESVPTELFMLRGAALQHTRRVPEARKLYSELAVSRALQRKNDPRTMIELGEMLHSVELHDIAIKLIERAGRLREIPFLEERILQIQTTQRLASEYELLKTANFDLRYPREMSPLQAEFVGMILEKELERLKKFIPLGSFERVTVNIMQWEEFRDVYASSGHILAFYHRGKITLPFAGVPEFIPEVVAILSHELTHAMLAQATNEQAPRWFHEGLAQRLQMERYSPNAFNWYEDDKLFSLAVLDAVMTGSPDPGMMQEAYIESQTLIRFIESKYGWKAIHELIAAFRGGATTDEAIALKWNQPVAEFDLALRAWGRSGSRVFENPEPIRYDRRWDEVQIEFQRNRNRS